MANPFDQEQADPQVDLEQTPQDDMQAEQPMPEDTQPIVRNTEVPEPTFQDRSTDKHPELTNLALYLSEEDLKDIGNLVYEEYEEDELSRREWLEKQRDWLRIYNQDDKPVLPPWQGSSDESIPILLEACNQFHARSYKAFFGTPTFVAANPTGGSQPQPEQEAAIDAQAQAPQTAQAPPQGMMPGMGQPSPMEALQAPQTTATDPAAQQQDRADRIGKFMSWQLSMQDRSYMRNKDSLLKSLPLTGSVFTKTYRDPVTKRNIVENVRAVDLAVSYSNIGIQVEDVERKTQVIWMPLRKGRYLASQEWFRKAPMEFFGEDHNIAYQEEVQNFSGIRKPSFTKENPARILEQHRWLDLDKDGVDEPYIVWVDCQTREVLRLTIRWEVDPQTMAPTDNKQPIEYFTHYTYFENPDGFYGLGLGHLLGKSNKAVNKMLRQVIDAATLQNMHSGFATRRAGLRKGFVEMELGKFVTLDGDVDDIKKHVMFLDHPGPSTALISLMEMIISRADRLGMVTEMTTGQPDKVYQPTTALSLVEQALMTFTATQIRVHGAMEQELMKLYRLNQLFLEDVVYFTFNDGSGPQDYEILKDDFHDEIHVLPSIDPTHSTDDQKVHKAQLEYQTGMANKLVGEVPRTARNLTQRFFRAIGSKNIDDIVPTEQELQQLQQAAQAAQQAQQQGVQQQQQVDNQLKAAKVQTDQQKTQILGQQVQTDGEVKTAKLQQNEQHHNDKMEVARVHEITNAAKAAHAASKANATS